MNALPPYQPSSTSRMTKLVPLVALTAFLGLLTLATWLQHSLDGQLDQQAAKIEELAQLPRGEYLKPALLGYHHLGADLLWLRMLQVFGKKHNSADEHAWIYHAIDVITTLDPQYAYPYYVGGVVLASAADRVDLSNRLLEKGYKENPGEWNLAFLLGYNHYFLLGDTAKGAEYIERAARTAGAPDFLSSLATRMLAEAGNPDVALQLIDTLLRDNPDLAVRESLAIRAKEVMIERDIRILDAAISRYRQKHAKQPIRLSDLVSDGIISHIPDEQFEGVYQLNPETGKVSSSTHPTRLKVFRPDKGNLG